MSSSSDIEKLFDHFGGDANAYQEIGRENEAHSARTRWPLLVTLDLTQPAIPAIGQHREPKAKTQTAVSAAASLPGRDDTTPKDVAAVTRAKAPLFTRSHRRDIPPVVAAAPQPVAPSGASRFGVLEAENEGAARDASADAKVDTTVHVAQYVGSASNASVTPGTPAASVSIAPVAASAVAPPVASTASVASVASAASAASADPVASAPAAFPLFRPAASQTPLHAQAAAPTLTQAPASAFTRTFTPASAMAQAPAPAFSIAAATGSRAPVAQPVQPTQPTQPASILGKLFTPAPQSAPPQPAAQRNESAPLHSVFDRLRGAPAPTSTSTTPASASSAAASGGSNSWLVNGPRRS
jgi:hypothetical protein